MPGRAELGDSLTHREAGELDEGIVDAERTASDAITRIRGSRTGVSRITRGPGEGRIPVGADHAVLGRGARIDVQVFAGASLKVVAHAVLRTNGAVIGATINAASVEASLDAQITTQLDAGVGARDVVESGTIQGADPHVFDRFGLYGKIGRLCPTQSDQTRC